MIKLCRSISVLLLASILSETAFADILPAGAQAEQVRRNVTQDLTPTAPFTAAAPIRPTERPAAVNEAAKKIKFKLEKIKLTGNHVYSTKELEPIYADKLHKTISVDDVFAIRDKITAYYRNNGYILSRAILPPQRINEGVVHIQVIEGYIDKITVSGNPKRTKSLVAKFGETIKSIKPLQLKHMEKYLFLANEIPGTTVKSVFSPSEETSGAADLDLNVDHRLLTGYMSYDDYGTRYLGPQQFTANLGLNTILMSGDLAQATLLQTPNPSELLYTDLNYNFALNGKGDRFILGGNNAKSRPQFILQSQDIVGRSANYYFTYQHPFIRTYTQSLTLQSTLNIADNNTTIQGAKLYTDHIRSVSTGVNYALQDRWSATNNINGYYEQGLPILGYTSNFNPATAQTSNPGGRAVFTKFTLQMSRLQPIKGPFSIVGLMNGQFSFQPLLSSEQYTFGGSQLGRGYDSGEIIGDRGIAGSLELREQLNLEKLLTALQFYTFYDIGTMRNIPVTVNTVRTKSASSFGLGMRYSIGKYISGNFMWAQPLTKKVDTEMLQNNGTGNGWAPRVFFSVVASLA